MNIVNELLPNNAKRNAQDVARRAVEEMQKLDGQIAEFVDEEGIGKDIYDRSDFQAVVHWVICRILSFVMGKSVEKSNLQQGSQVYSVQGETSMAGIEQTVQDKVNVKHLSRLTKPAKLSLSRSNGDPTT